MSVTFFIRHSRFIVGTAIIRLFSGIIILTGETFQVLAAVNLPLIKRHFHVPALSGTEKSS